MWNNTAERGRPQMAIWRMRIECWIIVATHMRTHAHPHIHKQYVVIIVFHRKNGCKKAPLRKLLYIRTLPVLLNVNKACALHNLTCVLYRGNEVKTVNKK
jgi:hypothetical protein